MEQQKANAGDERHGAQRDRDKRLLHPFFQIALHGAGNACRLILFMGIRKNTTRRKKLCGAARHPLSSRLRCGERALGELSGNPVRATSFTSVVAVARKEREADETESHSSDRGLCRIRWLACLG